MTPQCIQFGLVYHHQSAHLKGKPRKEIAVKIDVNSREDKDFTNLHVHPL
jgi:hypothetical protein